MVRLTDRPDMTITVDCTLSNKTIITFGCGHSGFSYQKDFINLLKSSHL